MIQKKKFSNITECWPVIAYLVITILIFNKAFLHDLISMRVGDDGHINLYAWSYYFTWAIKNGCFPFWDFMTFCGQPFGTDPPSNFNILNMLSVFFGPKTAWSIRHMFCVFLAGYFTYVYAKSVNISRFSAFICGIVYMFTSTVIVEHIHTMSFFIPLVFICLEKAVKYKKNTWIVFASILTAVYYLNANPQFALYVFVFHCCYIIYRHYSLTGKVDLTVTLRYLVIFAVLTFGFSAIQFFRLYEIALDSQRTISFHTNSYVTMLPTNLITMIIPYFYESPFRPVELNFFFGRFWLEVSKNLPAVLGRPSIAFAPYVGVLGIILGILAFLKRAPRSLEKFFGWCAVVTVVFMSTSFLWHMIIKHIPILNQLMFLHRVFVIYEFSLAILVGIGVDILLNNDKKVLWQGTIKWTSRIIVFTVAAISVVFSIVHLIVYYNKDYFFKVGEGLINKHVIANPSYIGPPELYDIRLEQLYQFFCSWTNTLDPSFLISIIIIILCAFVLYLYRRDILKRRLFRFAVIFLILGDLLAIVPPSLGFTPAKDVAPVVRAAEFIKNQPGLFRVFRLQDVRNLLKPEKVSFLRPNTNIIYGLSSVEGGKSLMRRRYVDFIGTLDEGVSDDGFITGFQNFNSRIIDLTNVRYIVTSNNRSLGKGFKLAYIDQEYRVYENQRALPRAFMVYKSRIIEEKKTILTTLLDPGFKLDKEIVLEEEGQLIKRSNEHITGARVQITRYEPNQIHVKVYTPGNGYLFLSDNYDPGWRVYVDGKRDKIYRADYTFRAVELPEGDHEVEFVYKPSSVKTGVILFFVSVIFSSFIFLGKKKLEISK